MFVVSTETWPSQSRTVLMSTPPRRRWVAVERRIVCGLTFFVAKDGIPHTALRTYRVTKS
jgi:hypothetical protein